MLSALVYLIVVILNMHTTFGHYHESYFRERNNWDLKHYQPIFEQFPDNFIIEEAMLLGTHNSAAYDIKTPLTQCQILDVFEQLTQGVRVLDIRLRQTNDRLACHHSFIFLNRMFGDVLRQTIQFLVNHPKEIVIMALQRDAEPDNTNNKSLCTVLDDYIKEWGGDKFFIKNFSWKNNTYTIGEARGKIILFGIIYYIFVLCVFYCLCDLEMHFIFLIFFFFFFDNIILKNY